MRGGVQKYPLQIAMHALVCVYECVFMLKGCATSSVHKESVDIIHANTLGTVYHYKHNTYNEFKVPAYLPRVFTPLENGNLPITHINTHP